ncbi:MAG: sulfatase [Actinomycetota bacterium]
MRFRRSLLALAVFAPLIVSAIGAVPGRSAATTPTKWQRNVVVIVTDDQRWDTLGAPGAMPNVNKFLVDKGVTFPNGFVTNPQCCPSRASIFTGQYSHGTGVYKNFPPHGGFASFNDTSTVATWLKRAGYDTALVGKYLNGYHGKYIPPGWDHWFAADDKPAGLAYYDYHVNDNGTIRHYGSKPRDYGSTVMGNEAANFIRHAPSPFFLYFALSAPHSPAVPPPGMRHRFSHIKPWRPPSYNEGDMSDKPPWARNLPKLSATQRENIDRFRKDQYRTLAGADDQVGKIISALKDTGRLSNTLIVFMSDNGILWGEHRFKSKRAAYEESIRVPFVVRYDPLVAKQRVDDRMVLGIDVAPTIAALAGVAAPGADGRSLLQPLRYPFTSQWRSDFLVEHMSENAKDIPTYCAVRNETTMYVDYATGSEELYDLTNDPYELQNQAGNPAFASVLSAMRARLAELCVPPPPGSGLP